VKRDVPLSKLDASGLLLLLLLVFGVVLAFGMVRPFLDALLIAGIFAIIMNPIYQRLLALSGDRRSLAAFLTSLLLTVLVVIPGFILLWQLLGEATAMFQTFTQWVDSDAFQELMRRPRVVRFITAANRYLAEFKGLATGPANQGTQDSQLIIQIATAITRRILNQGTYVIEHTVSLLGNFIVMIFAFFFILRDQEQLRRGIFRLLPFTRGHEDDICQQIVIISRSALLGIFLTAIAQGTGAAAAFWITGIPVLFGSVATAFASFIPLIGTTLVWLPATVYLLLTGKVGSAIFLSIWWVVVVGFILDNILRPLLMSGRTEMSTPLVFLFILGGIHFFGLAGVLYGPFVLGALYMLLYLYDLTMAGSRIEIPKEHGLG